MRIHGKWFAVLAAVSGAALVLMWPLANLPSRDQGMKDVMDLVARNAPPGCTVADPVFARKDANDANQQAALGYAEQHTGVSLVCDRRRENYGVSTYGSRASAMLRSWGMTYCFDRSCQKAEIRGYRLLTFSYQQEAN